MAILGTHLRPLAMLAKLLKFIFIGGTTIVLLLTALVGVTVYGLWYDNSHKQLLQTLPMPARHTQYQLMTDISGLGDRAWYVYERSLGMPLSDSMKRGHDLSDVLFWNYSEWGDHSGAPTLTVIGDRYLVFARGGRYYSLYDIAARRVVVNEKNPWIAFAASPEYARLGPHPSLKNLELAMDGWVATHLELPILTAIGVGARPLIRSVRARRRLHAGARHRSPTAAAR